MSVVQSVDFAAIGPAVAVAITALVVLLAGLFLPDRRAPVLSLLSLAGLGVAGVLLLPLWGEDRGTFCVDDGATCSYVATDPTLVLQALTIVGTAVVVLLSASTVVDSRLPSAEYHFLLLSSAAGAVTLAAARDLATVVVAIEVVSLPVFGLVALRRDSRSSEAALKMFLVSVVSTAVMLYGMSLIYGVTGSLHLDRIAEALAQPELRQPVTALAVVATLAGFAFKIAAVPFHAWAPETYVGAPIPIAAYLSVVSKAAGFMAFVFVMTQGFEPYSDVWAPVIGVVAAVSMTLGNLVALRTRHAVRLLAWSSIAQSAYMLVPLAALSGRDDATPWISATVAYLLVYAVMNLGAFSVVALVARERPGNALADYRGLARERPLSALALAFFLLSLAGLPPALVGLFAKIVVFDAAVRGEVGWLAVVMAVNTVVALYYYLWWAASLFQAAPATAAAPAPASATAGTPSAGPAPAPVWRGVRLGGVPAPLALAIGITLVGAVALSVAPGDVLDPVPAGTVVLR